MAIPTVKDTVDEAKEHAQVVVRALRTKRLYQKSTYRATVLDHLWRPHLSRLYALMQTQTRRIKRVGGRDVVVLLRRPEVKFTYRDTRIRLVFCGMENLAICTVGPVSRNRIRVNKTMSTDRILMRISELYFRAQYGQ